MPKLLVADYYDVIVKFKNENVLYFKTKSGVGRIDGFFFFIKTNDEDCYINQDDVLTISSLPVMKETTINE